MKTNKYIELQRLIYGMTGIMPLLETEYKSMIEEMEMIRSSVALEGFILRPAFSQSKELTSYTNQDWEMMFNQYAVMFGFSCYNESGLKSVRTRLSEYKIANSVSYNAAQTDEPNFDVRLDGMNYINEILLDIANSKIVLREHQIQIINESPVEALANAWEKCDFVIKESEILFAQALIKKGSNIEVFSSVDQIVRFVVSAYQTNENRIEGQLNTSKLSQVRLKIPTSVRKRIIKRLNSGSPEFDAIQGKKYQAFIKTLIKQCMWMPMKQTKKRFPNFAKFSDCIYRTIPTVRTEIEELKRAGKLKEAFDLEMKNPGDAIRNLLFYLRYRKGETFATKNRPNAAKRDTEILNKTLDNALRKTKSVIKKKILKSEFSQVDKVETSAVDTILSDEFYKMLQKCNNKLLWQIVTLLEDNRYFEEIYQRECNKVKVSYAKPLPAINKEHASIVAATVKTVIGDKLREQNANLGNVYLDKSLEDTAIAFSGRESTEVSCSGSFLAPGSKIDINDAINDPEKLIRLGVAWRGRSTDLDHTVNLINKRRSCSYSDLSIKSEDGQTMISSSGDIQSCNQERFSTELVDFDPRLLIEDGEEFLISSVNNYSNSTNIEEYEAYAFFTIIDKSERVKAGTQVYLPLDAMQYAIRLNTKSSTAVNLFVDLINGKIEPINLEDDNVPIFSNCRDNADDFLKQVRGKQNIITAMETLSEVIDEGQIVDSMEEADTVILAERLTSSKEPVGGHKDFIYANIDSVRIQSIVF